MVLVLSANKKFAPVATKLGKATSRLGASSELAGPALPSADFLVDYR